MQMENITTCTYIHTHVSHLVYFTVQIIMHILCAHAGCFLTVHARMPEVSSLVFISPLCTRPITVHHWCYYKNASDLVTTYSEVRMVSEFGVQPK